MSATQQRFSPIFTQAYDLADQERDTEIQALVESVLAKSPDDPEVIFTLAYVSYTPGEHEPFQQKVADLLEQSPSNPYYIIANAIIALNNINDFPSQPEHQHFSLLDAVRQATLGAGNSPDALAKVAFFCISAGFWSLGLTLFLQAQLNFRTERSLLFDRLSQSFAKITESITAMDFTKDLNAVPFPIILKALRFLSAFSLTVPEARLATNILVNEHKQLKQANASNQLLELIGNPSADYQ